MKGLRVFIVFTTWLIHFDCLREAFGDC